MVYSGGLGVTSGDDQNGDDNQHTIDNDKRKDFIILQFDKPVALMTATFNTFSVRGQSKDSDATIKYGWSDLAWNSGLNLNNKNVSVLNALFDGTYTSFAPSNNGASNTRNINPDLHWGDIWLIGADFTNTDRRIDGFKITNLAVIPEPATWAMMIAGFGFVGAVARRRARPQFA
ncbi:PEPxxWA-CTERM sorting domain-containing protein [Sphingomonas sp. MAH-20]|uniref:PEPxxWA-CTERM sorting domain-containing protein n=2 Tax=Sphingomonadaceae TaxID=41297 RepID=A0A6I4J5C3_9SPHN|nr:PEP-CTERM sorting domain-containing protein [Sphingomonas sp. CGMCC 1.13658]MVO79318.1 PEPxxWA-CTERM sorting domain-containing protein [Sphingomonas horti]